jgi:hypothetical protein
MKWAVRILVCAVSLAVALPVTAKRPPDHHAGRQILPDESEPSLRTGSARVSRETGAPLALYRVQYPVRAAEPEIMARQYLAENAGRLGLRRADLSDLAHRATRHGAATTTVRFDQTYQGVPVYGAELAVTLDRQARVTFVMNGYKSRVELPGVSPTLGSAAARRLALAHLGVTARPRWERMDLVVWHAKGRSRLAHRLRVEPGAELIGDWEVLVDATNGEVFRVEDRACYHASHAPTATGTARVFAPDPLSSAQVSYGATGYVDGADADTAQLTSQLANVSLLDIDFTGGIHTLKGPFAEIQDFEAPFKGLFTQASSNFETTRSPDLFEAANTYYHIDAFMRYINSPAPGGLGLTVMPYQYVGGVRFDPHGLNGADNSHYLTGSGRVSFGEGGVDDDEDADVIIHELGHGLHDWVTNGGLSQVNGLSEGSGDYVAASYSRAYNQWPSATPQYNWVFDWDGHNPFWNGRVTNWPNLYPGGLTGQIHTDGQIWATCLMRIWNQLGRQKTDKVFLEGLGMTTGSTNQDDAAQALMQAAFDLGYSAAEQLIMFNEFTATGYTVIIVPVELQRFQVD